MRKIEKAFAKIAGVIAYLIFLAIVLEVSSALILKGYDRYFTHRHSKFEQLSEARKEVEETWRGSVLMPTRWYASKPNYRGKHVTTDRYGFRIEPDSAVESKSIGFYGGSTMFSVMTDQRHTIPASVNLKGFNSLNFGVPGYSTSAEFPTFVESLRLYPNIKAAVFYDGVNEVGRMLEYYESGEFNDGLFKNTGYYSPYTMELALSNLRYSGRIAYNPKWMELIYRVYFKLLRLKKDPNPDQKLDQTAELLANQIAELYVANVRDISAFARAKGIKAVFVWQPTLFTTKKALTTSEQAMRDRDKSLAPTLMRMVTDKVLADKRLKEVEFIDLTNVFDGISEDLFLDWNHVTGTGNSMVANKLTGVLTNWLAADLREHPTRN